MHTIGARDLDAALIVRTDFDNEPAWLAIVAELRQPWGEDEERDALVHIVEDPLWSGATVQQVRAAAQAGDGTVFLVDAIAVAHSHFAMLAVDLGSAEDIVPGQDTVRVEPSAVQDFHAQRFIDNMSFMDFVDQAARDSEGIVWSPY
ncbi:DUF6924 domain-containing protein [Streptomyces sp. NPDC101181]|uniref:DUF6924 domain-containing protein n=1 Tax=Streptomyces sp. NPDC101181 TaxID=3366125 RepID=UPI00380F8682